MRSRSGSKASATRPLEEEDQEQLPATEETPESIFIASSQKEMLQNALAELPVPFREILLLCDFEEMSYQEISDTLGIPAGTVMSRLSRARRALRLTLSKKLKV